jgi:hypothetical protein
MTKKQQEALDRQLAYWAATDKQHKATVKRLAKEQEHELDWFDVVAYQRHIYSNGWNK